MKTRSLTKSLFLEYIQCPERLNKSLSQPGEIDEATRNILQNGNEVGLLARGLFPEGVEVGASTMCDGKFEYLRTLGGIFFEAPFKTKTLLARVDILTVLPDGTLKISEVKSTTSFKEEEHISDIYFQKIVIEECTGLKVSKLELIHVNKDYVFDGTWDVSSYFTVVKVPISNTIQKQVNKKINECLKYLSTGFPDFKPGPQCKKPYVCPHFDKCTKNLGTILDLRRGGKKTWEFVDEGIKDISDIKDVTKLSVFQLKQYEAEKFNKPYLDIPKIREFLERLVFPCSMLDFEGFSTPIIHKLRLQRIMPYEQIIFQANLKIAESLHTEDLNEFGLIADRLQDPRKQIADFLIKNIPDSGSVVVYFKNYEVSRIGELSELYPEYRSKFNSIINRIVDLEEVFSRPVYIDYRFKGSSSLKKVLGIVCPELSTAYKDLPLINNGQMANIKYLEYFKGLLGPQEEKKLFEALDLYCSLDVLSMWKIIQQLRRICEERK